MSRGIGCLLPAAIGFVIIAAAIGGVWGILVAVVLCYLAMPVLRDLR